MAKNRSLVFLAALASPCLAGAEEEPVAPPPEANAVVAQQSQVIQNDVAPSLVVYSSGGVSLALGGLLQLRDGAGQHQELPPHPARHRRRDPLLRAELRPAHRPAAVGRDRSGHARLGCPHS